MNPEPFSDNIGQKPLPKIRLTIPERINKAAKSKWITNPLALELWQRDKLSRRKVACQVQEVYDSFTGESVADPHSESYTFIIYKENNFLDKWEAIRSEPGQYHVKREGSVGRTYSSDAIAIHNEVIECFTQHVQTAVDEAIKSALQHWYDSVSLETIIEYDANHPHP